MIKYFESADALMENFVSLVEENEMSYAEAEDEAKRIIDEMYDALFFYEEEKDWDGYASKESYNANYEVFEEFKSRAENYCMDMRFESAC